MSVSSYAKPMRALMGQTVTIEPRTGITGNGVPIYGPARTFRCSVLNEYRQIINTAGQQVVASGQIVIYPVADDGTLLTALNDYDRVTRPDGKQPLIHAVVQEFDQRGNIVDYILWT